MTQFVSKRTEPESSGFNRMGKPLPESARPAAYKHCREIGLDSARSWKCIQGMAEQLERDQPHEAMNIGMKFMDLTGTYRIMAVLLSE